MNIAVQQSPNWGGPINEKLLMIWKQVGEGQNKLQHLIELFLLITSRHGLQRTHSSCYWFNCCFADRSENMLFCGAVTQHRTSPSSLYRGHCLAPSVQVTRWSREALFNFFKIRKNKTSLRIQNGIQTHEPKQRTPYSRQPQQQEASEYNGLKCKDLDRIQNGSMPYQQKIKWHSSFTIHALVFSAPHLFAL
jgi:hypothetical protein